MNIDITKTVIALVVFLTIVVGGIFLQIFLSKKKSKWTGLILPGITLLYSLIMIFSLAAFQGMTSGQILIQLIITFLIANIPTYILLGIYFGCREKFQKNSQIDKMNIQDLK